MCDPTHDPHGLCSHGPYICGQADLLSVIQPMAYVVMAFVFMAYVVVAYVVMA